MKIICTICARGGSSELKNKNIKKIFGIPLIMYTIAQAKNSKIFDKIVVSSDSSKILNIVKKKVDLVIKRPQSLSTNLSPKIPAIRHALKTSESFFKKNFDLLIDLDVTSPLRTSLDIIKAKKNLLKKNYLNLVSVCFSKKNPYFNMIEKKNSFYKLVKMPQKKVIFNRQKAPNIYDLNASIYVWKREALLSNKLLINKKTGIYIMPRSRSIDIDSLEDFELVEYYIKKNRIYYDLFR